MADLTVKRTEEFETTFRGHMLKARSGLGVTAFGMQIVSLPEHANRYPEHDHSHDGQEEVYLVLTGSATLVAGGEEHALTPGVFARVGPDEKRTLTTGEERAEILVLGGIPGKAFEPVEFTEEGQPDPMAAPADG